MRSTMRAPETTEEKPLPRLKRGYDQDEIAELRAFKDALLDLIDNGGVAYKYHPD